MISSSKWSLHKFFSKSPLIRPYLPPTSVYQPSVLETYLSKYDTVFIKPTLTHMGQGILKVWKTENGYQAVKEKGQSVEASSLEELKKKLSQQCTEKSYVIQKGIDLAEVDGRPFDIRVMMMRNGAGRWQYVAMLAKVAGPASIITNVARGGGYAVTVPFALSKSNAVEPGNIREVARQLIRLSYQICHHFNKYKRSSQIGIDFAIDKKGNIAIIEVNYDFPSHALFYKLKDKSHYWRIRRMYFQYRNRMKKRKRRA